MILLLLSLTTLTQKSIRDQPMFLDGASDKYASQYLFITTPVGIYQYNRTSATWGRFTEANGLPDNQVDVIGLDKGILWTATPKGLASSDVRINDWRKYDLPGPVTGLAFDNQYVWAGGRFGLKRFDKYAETWEEVSSGPVNDIYSEKGYVWLATDAGVLRYNREYDRIESVPAPNAAYGRIIATQRRIWFIGSPDTFRPADHSTTSPVFAAVMKSDEKWSSYSGFDLAGYSAAGESLFAVGNRETPLPEGSARGVSLFLYDPASDDWIPFRGIENLPPVRGISTKGKEILLATDDGLTSYDWSGRTTRSWRRANGLQTDSLLAVYGDDQMIFAISRRDIQLLNRATGIWKPEAFTRVAKKRDRIVGITGAGAYFRPARDVEMTLSGRAYYSDSRTVSAGFVDSTKYENVALNLKAQYPGSRASWLYYDDTDRDQIVFGLEYRGSDRDMLYRANAGYVKTGYSNFDLIPEFSLLGGNARLRWNAEPEPGDSGPPLTPRPTPLAVDLQGGKLQSRLRSDFFTGRSIDKHLTLRDVQYVHNAFYRVFDTPRAIAPGTDTIFVDDRNASDNGPQTRVGFTVGGITGDFDPLLNGKDYYIDYRQGVVRFLSPRRITDVVVLVLNGAAIIIQSDAVPGRLLENVYVAGADIVPGSLQIVITDTSGLIHPLSEFGLDADGDNQVDPEFVNYDLGYLTFPAARPFPEPVYHDSSRFVLSISFRSLSLFYYLTYHPIEKNSEQVVVDGEALTQGADYVMDYTSGVLLFLRDDLVSDFSEIDVRYASVERNQQSLFYAAQPNLTLGDHIEIAPGFSHIERANPGGKSDTANIVHLSGRTELGSGDRGNLRFVPQVAYSLDRGLAQDYLLTGNYRIFSGRAEYRDYTADFQSFGAGTRRYGDLRHSAAVSAGIEPLNRLRLDGSFRRDYQDRATGTPQSLAAVQYVSGKLSYLNPKYPNGYLLIGRDDLPDRVKHRIKLSLGSGFTLLKTTLKLSFGSQRVVETSRDAIREQGDSSPGGLRQGSLPVPGHVPVSDTALEYVLDAGLTLPIPAQANVRYRHNTASGGASGSRGEDELRARVNFDVIPGAYYTGSYDLRRGAFRMPRTQDVSLRGYFYNDLGIAPGRWWSRLSFVNLSLGTGSNFDEYARGLGTTYRAPAFVIAPIESLPISHVQDSRTMYGSVQFNPTAGLMLRLKRTKTLSGVADYALPVLMPLTEDEFRVEYEPKVLGSFITLYGRRVVQSYPVATAHTFYFEWNRPWTQVLLTKLTANYRKQGDSPGGALREGSLPVPGAAATSLNDLTIGFNPIARFGSNAWLSLTAAGNRRQQNQEPPQYAVIPGAGFSVKLLGFLYLQFDYQSTLNFGTPSSHSFSARITGQF